MRPKLRKLQLLLPGIALFLLTGFTLVSDIDTNSGFNNRKQDAIQKNSQNLDNSALSEGGAPERAYLPARWSPFADSTENSPGDSLSQADSLMSDSLAIDSLAIDSLALDSMSLDSTARIKFFKHQRKPSRAVPFREKKKSSFYVYPSNQYVKRKVELDSTGTNVIIQEEINGKEFKTPIILPLDEYIAQNMEAINRKNWEDLGYKYELKASTKDLSQLLTDITNIQIPLPSTSFLSIFGPPEINLRISGAVDIHGAWRSETTEGIASSRLGNTRNEPDFKQQVQINVNGTIGDKLTINADWNTERTFEYENQLKIKYTGYEDEIVQSVEAGNVSLQTSSLVGGSEALFGVKAKFQLGPFSLTALASQKKGEVEEVSVTGGSETQEFEIHAYEYSQNHFFIDQIYADPNRDLFFRYYGNAVPDIESEFQIKDIEVWKTASGIVQSDKEREITAMIDLPERAQGENFLYDDLRNTSEDENGRTVAKGRFIQLTEGVDYEINEYVGVISFKTSLQAEDAIAVSYRQEGPSAATADDDVYYGEFVREIGLEDSTKTLVMKLVKPPNLQPQFRDAWQLQLKNIYPIKGRDVKEEGFVLDVNYIIEGQDPVTELGGQKLIQAFGLDNTDASQQGGPDGAFDFIPGRTIIPSTGEIIFPVLQPFGDNFPENLSDSLRYNAVYDTTVTFAKQDRAKDKFIITGEYSASVTSVYNIGFNVVENSAKVYLNGNELREGSDYSVDYNIGQITIRNDAALVPGADLKITYEKNDLFALASKTLIGFRGLYEFNKDTRLGFSYLNLNQQTLSDKVRIGEEPLNNSIFGLDFATAVELPFVTKALDNVISTKTMSRMTLKGEYAYMDPEPNTKSSTIESDGGKSIAYIDDFEGSKRIIPIGIADRGWKDLSPPLSLVPAGDGPADIMRYKAKSYWFNIIPSETRIQDIWGDRKQVSREDEQVTVLDYVFEPTERGTYNLNPEIENPMQNWGGMMKILSSTANNLVEENVEFIEFWLNISNAPEGAKLNIDLGQISEDVIPNNQLDTEDKNQNDLEEEGEDTGIDGLFNEQEEGYDPVNNPDPAGDDFSVNIQAVDYRNVNGTENNAEYRNAGIKLPDSEDLNRNFTLNIVNSYFRYELELDTNSLSNPFISGEGENGWYQFRIPLKDWKEKIGDPSFSVVEFIRVWFSEVNSSVHLRFAEFNLVGNQWQKQLTTTVTEDDEVLTLGTINVEDNPTYVSPPGVNRERDRSKPDEEVYKNEQSLQLIINDLEDGDYREVVKYLYRPLDVFNYKEMKLFIHGDEAAIPGDVSYFMNDDDYGSEVYFRFGSDSLNFYEYRQPVKPDWNEIRMVFKELTAIKQARTRVDSIYTQEVPGEPGHSYGIKGNPSLTKVTFFTVGIINPKNKGEAGRQVSGELWINELRVLDAENTPGWAYSASTSFQMADFITFNFNMSQTDPYFHRLSERFGSRIDRRSWGGGFDMDVLKLIPGNLQGSNLRVNYSRTESVSKPQFLPGTDIEVNSAVEQEQIKLVNQGVEQEEAQRLANEVRDRTYTINVSDSWSLSNIKFKIPSNAWYIRDTFNSLSFNFNFNKTYSRNPNTLNSNSWVWNASAKYAINLSKDYFFYPANIPILGYVFGIFEDYRNVKVYYTPANFSSGLSAKRNYSFTQTRSTQSAPSIQRDFTSTRNFSFNWIFTEGGFLNLGLDYNADFQSSLAYLLTRELSEDNLIPRTESEIWADIFGGAYFGKDYNFRQAFNLKANPKLPTLWDLNKFFQITMGYSANYNWQFNFQQEELGRSAGYSNRINAGLTLRLKSLFEPLFESGPSTKNPTINPPKNQRGRGRGRTGTQDETNEEDDINREVADTTSGKPSALMRALNALTAGAHYFLFNYDQISANFTQTNSLSGSGIAAEGTGFNNFWGFTQKDQNGPSRAFMLGFDNELGPRAAGGNLSNNFSQKNTLDFKTSRPLWEGANIDLNWRVAWGINKTTKIQTDSLGNALITGVNSTGNIDRTFLSFPPSFFLSVFNSGIVRVNELYDPEAEDPARNLSDAFVQGFESLPIFSKIPFLADFARFMPRPNWRFRWSGLEKFSFFKSFAKRVSINHGYSSSFTEGWKIDPDGNEVIQTQKINYGFSPLLGLDVTFESLWGGDLTAGVKFNTKTSYDLQISTRNITESFSKDINITASYSKRGFNIPLFGISLQNDLEFSFSYTSGNNSVLIFEMDNFKEEGKPQDGTIRTTIEPRVKYVMSQRVTLSLFYKMTTVEPEGAARIPPTSTNEAGLDVHISIQ